MANKGGRPLKFKSNKALQEKIDAYFEHCIANKKPFTVSGLAYFLDVDRKTLCNYGEKAEFFHTIKKAKARIEAFNEESLYTNRNTAGVIFNLKNNFGWKDKNDINVAGNEAAIADKLREVFGDGS